MGSIGIICSSLTKTCSASVSANSSGQSGVTVAPACCASTAASAPTSLRLSTAWEQPPASFASVNAAAVSFASCGPVSFAAPAEASSFIRRSATCSSTKTCFSPMQSRLLSNAAPEMMSAAALARLPVPSTMTGGLPGPAQIARLPEAIAAFTTMGPPVTQRRRTCSSRVSAPKVSIVGFSTVQTRCSIPSTAKIASLKVRTASAAERAPPGCGLKTTAFPAATILMTLPLRVGIEWVTGSTAPTTPNGVCSSIVMPWSPLMPRGRSHSTPGTSFTISSLAILCSRRPILVSSNSNLPHAAACLVHSSFTISTTLARPATPLLRSCSNAAWAAAQASLTSSNTPKRGPPRRDETAGAEGPAWATTGAAADAVARPRPRMTSSTIVRIVCSSR